MDKRRGFALAFATAFLWGTIPIAGKVALQGFTPAAVTGLRLASGALILAVLLPRMGRAPLAALRAHPLVVVGASAALVGNYLLYFAGLAWTTGTAAQVTIQLASVFFLIWGVLLFGERFTVLRVAGVVLAVGGVALVSWNGVPWRDLLGSRGFLGNVLIMVSALSWSGYAVLQKKLNRRFDSIVVLAGVFAASAFMLAPVTVAQRPWEASALPLVALGFLALNSLLAYASFAESLQHLEAGTVAIVTTFSPLVTVALLAVQARVFPGTVEAGALTAYTLAGALLVVVGVGLAVRHERREAAAPRGAPPE